MKRILSLILVGILLIPLVACAGTPTTAPTTAAGTTAKPAATTAGTTTAAKPVNWAEPYKETVQVKVAYAETPNVKWAAGEDQSNNVWTKRWKEKYNVQVNLDWVSNEYATKLNLAIASKSLPDAFRCTTVQFQQLIEADLIEDLTSVYETYGSPAVKVKMDKNKDILQTGMNGTKLMGLPMLNYGDETLTAFVWMRKDWVEKAGIKEADVKTIAGYEKVMDTFMKTNGAKYGTMLEKTLLNFFESAAAFHAAPKIWVTGPDGKIAYGGILPETKVMLAKWAEWYAKGYINKDFTTIDTTVMLQGAFKGLVGTYFWKNWAGWQVGKDMLANQGDNSYFISYEMPSIDDKKTMYPIKFANEGYNVVRKGYKNPEVLVKLINDYNYTLQEAVALGTMTNEQVAMFRDSERAHTTGPFKILQDHYDFATEILTAFATGNKKLTSGAAINNHFEIEKWTVSKDPVGLGRYLQMGYAGSSIAKALKQVDNKQILKDKLWGATPQPVLDYGTTLDDLLLQGYTKIITGVKPIEYFDTLVAEWKAAGGNTATDAMNKMYK